MVLCLKTVYVGVRVLLSTSLHSAAQHTIDSARVVRVVSIVTHICHLTGLLLESAVCSIPDFLKDFVERGLKARQQHEPKE